MLQSYKNSLQYKNCIEPNNIIVLGPKNSGKSNLIYHLVNNQIKVNNVNYLDIFLFCNNSKDLWKSHLPFINYCNISDIEKTKNDILFKPNNLKKIVIFEDCINIIEANLLMSILNLQSYSTTVYVSSCSTDINFNISKKFDICFSLKYYNNLDLANIYNKFLHSESMNSFSSFKNIYNNNTMIPYNTFVIKNSFFSQEFFQFKADNYNILSDVDFFNDTKFPITNSFSDPWKINTDFKNIKSKLFDTEIFPKSIGKLLENDLDDIEKGFYKKLLDCDEKDKYDEIEDFNEISLDDEEIQDEIEDEIEDISLNNEEIEQDISLPEYSDPLIPNQQELKIIESKYNNENISNLLKDSIKNHPIVINNVSVKVDYDESIEIDDNESIDTVEYKMNSGLSKLCIDYIKNYYIHDLRKIQSKIKLQI